MAEHRQLNRRQMIVGGAAFVAFVAVRPWRTFVAVVEAPPAERLAALLPFTDSTRRVGLAYLRAYPDDADQAKLVGALTHSLNVGAAGGTSVLPRGRANLAVRATAVIRDELRSRTFVLLDGWITSPTEARLAALTTVTMS
jgi:hypothetical protein